MIVLYAPRSSYVLKAPRPVRQLECFNVPFHHCWCMVPSITAARVIHQHSSGTGRITLCVDKVLEDSELQL